MQNARHQAAKPLYLIALISVFLLGACSDDVGPSRQVVGLAIVETVNVEVNSPAPEGIRILVTGSLADPCTELDTIQQSRDNQNFDVQMATVREAAAVCVQVLVPFENDFLLEHDGLSSGDYAVVVNGVRAEFRIP